jgi:hypothetical protein
LDITGADIDENVQGPIWETNLGDQSGRPIWGSNLGDPPKKK